MVFAGAQGKVVPPCVRGVISGAHVPGNDRILFYSAVCGRRNSLQEGFFDKLCGTEMEKQGYLPITRAIWTMVTATWARVAVPVGLKEPSALPLMMPARRQAVTPSAA